MRRYPLIISFLLIIPCCFAVAEITGSDEWNFSFDLPEGFIMTDSNGSTCYIFSGSEAPVDFLINVYPAAVANGNSSSGTEKEIFKKFMQQLGATAKDQKFFDWNGIQAVLASVRLPIPESNGSYYTGIAAAFGLTSGNYLAAVSYADEKWTHEYLPEIYSAIDSINAQKDDLLKPGLVTSCLYPAGQDKDCKLELTENISVTVPLAENAAKANTAVIEREYRVLSQYEKSPLKMQAWERCYRMVYRDAFSRLDKPAFKIANAFKYMNDTPLSNYAFAQTVLTWLQSFTYESAQGFNNLLSLPLALSEHRGDCDTRGLLMAVILKKANIDTVLLLSQKAKHALPAVDVPGSGARFSANGKKYLLAETTAPVKIGLIDSAISDISLWKAFSFPD